MLKMINNALYCIIYSILPGVWLTFAHIMIN